MKQMQQNSGSPRHEPVRKPVLFTAVILGVVALAGAVLYLHTSKSPEQTQTPVETVQTSNAPAADEDPLLLPNGTNLAAMAQTPAPGISAVPLKTSPAAVENRPVRPEPSAYTKRLVDILSTIDTKTPMTPEKAGEWKTAMDQLVKEGAGSIPAIQQFLDKNEDVRFNYGTGTNLLGETTVRAALIEALGQISGPESLAAQSQLLAMTADPAEIAMLANQLEKAAPEQYRQLAMDAARSALEMAAAGKLPDRDVGPLFSLLQKYGDANTVDYLKGMMNNWRYYGAIALSDLPNGAGVPALVDMVKNQDSAAKGTRNVALWMLAQEADSDVARNTLLEQAKNSTVPCSSWIEISSILGGNVFYIGNPTAQGRVPVSGERSWLLRQGNQAFYSIPRTTPYAQDQLAQRLALIDQLIAANQGCPDMNAMLQKAKADLLARNPQPVSGQ